jgi:hypothetical protein
VVHPREPHHFEGEGLRAEVPHVPKRDGQIDLPDGERLHPGYDPMERRSQRPQRGPRDAVDGSKPCSSSPQAYG